MSGFFDTSVWAVIPAHRPALPHLRELLDLLGDLADRTVVVTNGGLGTEPIRWDELDAHLITDHNPEVNISRWWNMGLDWIADATSGDHHALVLNADARIGVEGIAKLSTVLDKTRSVMAGPDPHLQGSNRIHHETEYGPRGLRWRIPGYCFMLDSSAGLRADEQFRWWAGDDDLEWRARSAGGTALVGGIEVLHLGDGNPHPDLQSVAKADLWRFQEKWGVRPW
jgi:hypothetical protein